MEGRASGRQMTKHTNGRNTCFADPCQRAAGCHPESPCNRCTKLPGYLMIKPSNWCSQTTFLGRDYSFYDSQVRENDGKFYHQ